MAPEEIEQEIIRVATFAADDAVMACLRDELPTGAKLTAVAVEAAIRAALRNGVLVIPDHAEERLAGGFSLEDVRRP